MYIFGGELISSGVVANELWSFNLTSYQWQLLLPSNSTTFPHLPLAVRDHTAHVVGEQMLIIWGFAGNRGTVNTALIQQYDFGAFDCVVCVRACMRACVCARWCGCGSL